jgi:prevent-host-death family protein
MRATAAETRKQLAHLLDDAVFNGEHIEITRHGTPVAVLVPVDWYERAKEIAWEPTPDQD